MVPSPAQFRTRYGCRFCHVVRAHELTLNQHLDCHAFELQSPHGPRPVDSTNAMHPASIIRAVRSQTRRRLQRPAVEDAEYEVECWAWSLCVTLNSAQDVHRHRTLDRTELDAQWWLAFARAGFTPGSRSDPRTTRGWLEWQRNEENVLRRQQQRAADELRREQDEQAREDAEVLRLQRQAEAAEVLRLHQQAEAAAGELAARAFIDAEIAETLRLAEQLFRAEAAEAVLAAQRLAEETEARIEEDRERQRLAEKVEFEANSASWADEQLVLSQLDHDRDESASAIERATQQTALEAQAEEQTLLLHATHKGKGPSVAGPVSNNSWAIRNRGRGISGIVAANGPVSVSYGVGVSTDITAQAESSAPARKRRATCDPEQDPAPGTTIWLRLRDTNHVVLVPAYQTLASTIARFMESVDPLLAICCAGIMGAGKPPEWIAMTSAQWAGMWDDEVWAVVKSWGGRQRGKVEVEVEAVWCWE